MPVYLTFDIGTTALKTALVDESGRLLALHATEYTPESPHPDWAQMSAARYWEAAVAGTRAVFAQAGVDSSEVLAIGFSSQAQSFVPLDSAGKELYDVIVWVDRRTQALVDAWRDAWLSTRQFWQITGYPWLSAELTVFKLAWLAENAPQAHKAAKFLCLPDYLIYRLTGEFATDYNIAQMSGLYDLRSRDWSQPMLAAAGIDVGQLPQVHPPGTVVGQVQNRAAAALDIPGGIPVCTGCNDQMAGAIGAGNVRPGLVTETTGTALGIIITTESLLEDERIPVVVHAVPGLFAAMPFGTTSAVVLKWFRDLCAPGTEYDEFLQGVGEIAAGCDGLTVLPHFSGTALPTFNPQARGAINGLTLAHSRLHIARAIMESCACLLRELLDLVSAHGLQIYTVRCLGGAARSDLWLQIKADLLGMPLERPACSDAASLGAAALAAAATGQFNSIAAAGEEWYQTDRVFEPDESMYEIYREVYARYLDLYERLYE